MSDSSTKKESESKKKKQSDSLAPTIELRSDVGPGAVPKMPKLPKFPSFSGDKKTIGLLIGVALLLLIIAAGIFAALSQSRSNSSTEGDKDGLFGNLPSAADLRRNSNASAYSGMPCAEPDRRAIGVMMAGDAINRPMSGFSKADMVWELPVLASNVTRLLGIYQCGQPTDIGSVRSARHDYLFIAEGMDAIISHWGGSYHALNRIAAGEFDTINALGNPYNAFFRKNTLPAPYNGFTTYERLWNALQKLEYRTTTEFNEYEFKDDIASEERPSGGTLSIAWPGAFRVHYEYDSATNRYVRYWAGTKQVDAEDQQVVAPSSVVIMRATNGLAIGEGGYNEVGIEGTGLIEVYQDGKVITGTWEKDERYKNDPVHFKNDQGKPIIFTRGQVWVMTPSDSIGVTWEEDTTAPATTGADQNPATAPQ